MSEKVIIKCCWCNKLKSSNKFYTTKSFMFYSTNESKMQMCKKCMTKLFLEHLNQYYNGNYIATIKYMCMRFDVYYNQNIAKSAIQYPDNIIWGDYLGKIYRLKQYNGKTFEDNLKEGIKLDVINTERVKRVIKAGATYNQ